MTAFTTEEIVAGDGTTIGYRRAGQGWPLVITHGSICTGEQWIPVLEDLAADFEVFVYDRRGRGISGDAAEYSLATEAADIAAMLELAGPGAALLGHSYGAICTLEAIRTGAEVSAHIAYEPPLPVHGPTAGEYLAPYTELVAEGDLDGAMRLACDRFLRISEAEKEGVAASPLWPGFVELTPTWTRELEQIDLSVEHLDEYAASSPRTLLLVGTDSPGHLRDDSTFLEERLPDATRVDLEGQNHFAHVMDPKGVASVIRGFLQSGD